MKKLSCRGCTGTGHGDWAGLFRQKGSKMKKTMIIIIFLLLFPGLVSAALPAVSSGTLYLHLDADSLGLANGAAVTSWTDSVNGIVLSGNATYNTGYGNGHATVSFDGIDDYLANQLLTGPSTQNITMLVVGTFEESGIVSDFMTNAQTAVGGNDLRLVNGKTDNLIDIEVGGYSMSNLVKNDRGIHVHTLLARPVTGAAYFYDGVQKGSDTKIGRAHV